MDCCNNVDRSNDTLELLPETFGSSIYAKPINNLLNTIGLTHYSGHLEWVATDFSVLFFSFAVLDLNRKIQLHSTERFVLAIAWTLSLIAITNDLSREQ